MSIDISVDGEGRSLRLLVYQALKQYRTRSLFPLLADRDVIVRTGAARELQSRPESEEIFDYVKGLAIRRERYLREIAAFTLGQLGYPSFPMREQTIPILETVCADRAQVVRVAALAGLGHLYAIESEACIRKALSDPVPDVREMASEVLSRILS